MKKVYLVLSAIALITCLTGIPYLAEGIAKRGLSGVNYGRIIFPLMISVYSFWRYKIFN